MHAHRVKYDTIHGLLLLLCVSVFIFDLIAAFRLHPHQCQPKCDICWHTSFIFIQCVLHNVLSTLSFALFVSECVWINVWCHCHCRRRRSSQSGAEKKEKQQPCIEMKIWTHLNFHAPPNRALGIDRRLLNSSRKREKKIALEFMVFFSDKVSKWPMSLCANDGCSAQHTQRNQAPETSPTFHFIFRFWVHLLLLFFSSSSSSSSFLLCPRNVPRESTVRVNTHKLQHHEKSKCFGNDTETCTEYVPHHKFGSQIVMIYDVIWVCACLCLCVSEGGSD